MLFGMTRYQKFIVAILAFLQFTVILDFMVLAPLGAILMPALKITPAQFGIVVSVYAFSAGASGLLAAGFADRFDRKKLLLFFYAGFLLGTLLCGVAPTFRFLLFARMVTGLFGGVIGSIVFAITTDLFPLEMRGRVMGVVQTAFAASQVMGIPVGLFLANRWGWHATFLMIVAVSFVVGVVIVVYMRPIDSHLNLHPDRNAFHHLIDTLSRPLYIQAFVTTALLSTGGFMLMPFSSAFTVSNLGIALAQLPLIYMITGVFNILTGPLIGRLSDVYGKFRIFIIGSVSTMAMTYIYTHLGVTPLNMVILVNIVLFTTVVSRIISASALMSAVPDPVHRGSFMSISSSVQQIAGGFAAAIAGLIVVQTSDGPIRHYDTVGYVVMGAVVITMITMFFINRSLSSSRQPESTPLYFPGSGEAP